MSTPVRGPEGDDSHDKFLLYAPRRVREGAATHPPSRNIADAPPMAPGIGGPNIAASSVKRGAGGTGIVAPPMVPGLGRSKTDAPPMPPRFEGDIAIEAVRRRLALEPQPVPEPPIRLRRSNRMAAWIGRLFGMCALAGLGAFGVTWATSTQAPVTTSGDVNPVEPARPVAAKSARGAPPLARLVVESQRGGINEPLALGVSLDGKVSGETLLVAGFADGTRLSAGAPLGRNGWHLSAMDAGKAMAYAPPDFVGAMDARVDLRDQDRLVDSQMVRLEWLPKQPEARVAAVPQAGRPPADAAPVQPLAPDEIAGLLKRGEELLRTGDIASARLLLRRAANAGSAPAALAMGGTFDGAVLTQLGVLGFARDANQARFWYRKAAEQGSSEAEQRLEVLGRTGK